MAFDSRRNKPFCTYNFHVETDLKTGKLNPWDRGPDLDFMPKKLCACCAGFCAACRNRTLFRPVLATCSRPVLSAWVTGSHVLVIAQIRISPCQHRGLCRFMRVAARGGVHLLRRIVRRKKTFFRRSEGGFVRKNLHAETRRSATWGV